MCRRHKQNLSSLFLYHESVNRYITLKMQLMLLLYSVVHLFLLAELYLFVTFAANFVLVILLFLSLSCGVVRHHKASLREASKPSSLLSTRRYWLPRDGLWLKGLHQHLISLSQVTSAFFLQPSSYSSLCETLSLIPPYRYIFFPCNVFTFTILFVSSPFSC